ncbi:hypothetical protein [Bradyrhizobium liaoningense]|uniref:hypothetical protein n=1 Tax=Bradyrhizobium liaoningense TaxID=43992 RepID=UPI001BA6B68E|nr:hypothetical protein [Bradyrhizobium liaoningense]MBR1171824.1 hypothetical protein [Bradyrhizobium liaoningense]
MSRGIQMIGSRLMRGKSAIFACVGLALLLVGCSSALEEKLIQVGIGTELPVEDMAESTRRLEAYLSYLCEQAGGFRTETPDGRISCDASRYGGAYWTALVSAGFNDIDRRCDSYLAWLASRRRDRNAILSQIHDTRTFTEALLYTTGVSAAPIAIAGLAFGLASNSFTNYYSRLLFEIEKSTVSVLVREKRLQYRETFKGYIAYQPDAVHVLREYMLICTPFYIEDLVNQRTRDSVAGNTPADKGNADQIRRSMVAGALLNAIPKSPTDPLGGVGKNKPLPREDNMSGGKNPFEQNMVVPIGQEIQSNLCVSKSKSFDDPTRAAIRQAKLGSAQSGPGERLFDNTDNQINSQLEATAIRLAGDCTLDKTGTDRGYSNAFEKFAFPTGAGIVSLQKLLAPCAFPDLKDKFSGKIDVLTRSAIQAAKKKAIPALSATPIEAIPNTLDNNSYKEILTKCTAA